MKINNRDAIDYINSGKDFRNSTGSFRGEARNPASLARYPISSAGRLPYRGQKVLVEDQELYGVDYIVWSYDTPIAWRLMGGEYWRVPDIKYSSTTSRHQGIARRAVRRSVRLS